MFLYILSNCELYPVLLYCWDSGFCYIPLKNVDCICFNKQSTWWDSNHKLQNAWWQCKPQCSATLSSGNWIHTCPPYTWLSISQTLEQSVCTECGAPSLWVSLFQDHSLTFCLQRDCACSFRVFATTQHWLLSASRLKALKNIEVIGTNSIFQVWLLSRICLLLVNSLESWGNWGFYCCLFILLLIFGPSMFFNTWAKYDFNIWTKYLVWSKHLHSQSKHNNKITA